MAADGPTATASRSVGRAAPSHQQVVAALFVAGMFMGILDSTVVTTALPAIARQFGQPVTAADWVVIGYVLSLAVVMPLSGWLGDRLGTRQVFLGAICLFTGVSALCGTAPSLGLLIGLRILQGAGGGLLAPVGQAMLFRAYPPAQRARASAILMVPTVIAPAIGPVVGGLLVDTLSWRWIFFVNVPIGALAVAFGLLFLRETRAPVRGAFDFAGFAAASAGFACLLYAVSEGPLVGWTRPTIGLAAAVAAVALTAFARVELRQARPMLDLRLLRDRLFRSSSLVTMFGGGAFGAVLFLLPQFLQDARGASALSSGLTTFPEAVGVLLSSRLVAYLYPRVGPRRLMVGGLLGVTAFIVALCGVDVATSAWVVRILMFLIGAGMAYQILPLQAAAMARISASDMGHATAMFNTARQVAWATGVAITGTVVAALVGPSAQHTAPASLVEPYHVAFAVAGALALVSVFVSLTVHDSDAASTMVVGRAPPAAAVGVEA